MHSVRLPSWLIFDLVVKCKTDTAVELRSRRKGEKRSLNDGLLRGQQGQPPEVLSQTGTGCACPSRARSKNQHGRASASRRRRKSAEYTKSGTGNAFCYTMADAHCTARRLRLFKIHRDVSALPHHDVKDQPLIFIKLCERCSREAQRRTVRCLRIQLHLKTHANTHL